MAQIYPQETSHVTIQQPIPNTDPFKTMNNEWHIGLYDCFDDISQCCYAHWCWCCFAGSLAESIGESKCSCLCVPYALAMYRMKVRSILHIKGDTCSDHCATIWCGFCASLQMRNELKYHGLS